MPKLTAIVPTNRWISIDFDETPLRVSYRPASVTPRLQKAVAEARDRQDIDAGLLDPLCRLIASWDLTDDDEQPLPITPDAIADVPASILFAVLDAIGADMAPNRSRADASNSSSSPASSAPALNGTSSS